MFEIIAVLALLAVGAVAAVLVHAATRPDRSHVARTAVIEAPPDRIFALINDLRGWRAWSPYETKDPAMKRDYAGPPSGVGAVYAWNGNDAVGEGRMEIVEASPPSRIVVKLDFLRPFAGHNTATFTLAPQGRATAVTWAMDGPATYFGKLIGLFIDLDRMIGRDFETGLANLKTLAET